MDHNRFISPKPVCFWCLSDEVWINNGNYYCRNCMREWHMEGNEPVIHVG